TLVPLVTGDTNDEATAAALSACPCDDETLWVISSDLSHFLDGSTARMIDEETAEAIENDDIDTLTPRRACGARAIRGLLKTRGAMNLGPATRHDLRHSGDTAGNPDRVVGYGAWTLRPT
ncbi:MAG: AmmeMemoRadiSam system protein B, partial [Phycisphaeraceae bacterium]|nr:AmmeMemoRadiSam system protein B [Phycisphaeraceae bacterium]